MEGLTQLWGWAQGNMPLLSGAIAHVVLFASLIIKLTPTLADDNYWKPIVKFIGKYLALDKYGPPKTP